ncbi:endolytic transglycosylase MltG [Propioniciclava coleopterorum]|uniref:Endolytic murein transglycosylase n=1 Tax=Propioniciclava coleopterorum TaxID=2714937 RepID=A0A6G7Y9R6_9ACTN|nr:endolytic transglycosylase MltG [Propioniciclava coleopterorum]QIK73562.1 endolytic transglycosylase MltG [Propioniciclava coleopterorum]
MSPQRTHEPDRLRDPETGEWDMGEVRHRSKGWIAVLLALVVLVGGVWFVGGKAWDAWMGFRTKDDYIGTGVDPIQIEIPKGASMTAVGKLLEEKDVVKSADSFRRYAQSRPDESSRVQAGQYKMKTQMSVISAFDALLDPANLVRNMMQLREGQRTSEQIAAMAQASKLPVEEFQALVKAPTNLGLPEWAKGNVDGFLFPDTYELGGNPTAEGVMKMTVDNFNKVVERNDFVNQAAASPAKDPYTALIMASVVEREAMTSEDRQKVARVFYNRIAKGERLESDATVAYANNVTGRVTTTAEERKLDSPYNTYLQKNAGKLPPTPITSPSEDAIEAAVTPAEGNWMFFVVVNLDTGETVFSDTFEQHQQAVNQFREFCKTSDKC